MKRFKPLLPLGSASTVERCVRLFRDAGVLDVRVVIGYRADELKPVLDALEVRWLVNHDFAEGMFSSVKAGVTSVESSSAAFFLLPVDIPLVRSTTVLDLLAARDTQHADIFYPTFRGKRGHPPLIATSCRSALLDWGGEGGLRAFFDNSVPELRGADVPVADEHVLLDMDTFEDYQDLAAKVRDHEIPSAAECDVLLRHTFGVSQTVITHSVVVERVASELARSLNAAGCHLNLKLVTAAALLHDLAKGQPLHAAVAERLLKEKGYPAVARIVGAHTDVPIVDTTEVDEQDVVCLADKMVRVDKIVTVESRFRNSLKTFESDPRAAANIMRRRANVLIVKRRVEHALGSPVEAVLDSWLDRTDEDCHEGLSLQARTDRA